MKKKIFVSMLAGLMCISMCACGNAKTKTETTTTETTTEVVTDATITDAPVEKTVEMYNKAIHKQFDSIDSSKDSFTINAYMSDKADEFSDENWIMTLQHGPNITHIDDIYYLDAWIADKKIYYFDRNQGNWFSDDYNVEGGEAQEVAETFDAIKSQNFPDNANLYSAPINGIQYDVVEYTDEYGTQSAYYFNDKLELVYATSENDNSYLYISIDLSDVTLPTDVANAKQGDYEAYIVNLYNSMYNENSTEE